MDRTSGRKMIWGAAAGAGLIAALGAGLMLAAPAEAADMPLKAPRIAAYDRCAKVEPAPGTPSVPGGDIYGITSPTDIGDPCSWAFATKFTGRYGKRDGSYFAVTDKNQFSYTYSRDLSFAFSPFFTYNSWSNVAIATAAVGVGSFTALQFDGFSGEASYRILARGPRQPVAVTLSMEPRWARVDGLTGWRSQIWGNEFKLFADIAFTDNFYGAMNASYALSRSLIDLPGATWVDTSGTTLSAALTARVFLRENAPIEAVFIGAEARFQSAFTGLTLNQNVGNAFFAGPTMAIAFSGGRMLNLVWVPQLAGRAIPPSAPGALDLDNFERAQFRVKFATPL